MKTSEIASNVTGKVSLCHKIHPANHGLVCKCRPCDTLYQGKDSFLNAGNGLLFFDSLFLKHAIFLSSVWKFYVDRRHGGRVVVWSIVVYLSCVVAHIRVVV